MMLRIGLTGGIGSGKTTAAKIFELLDIPVYYSDEASKRLYSSNEELKNNIKKYFGEDIYTGKELNRTKLAAVVFQDKEKLKLLNQLVHPPTIKDAEEWMNKQTAPYLIKEAALLFESGSASNLHYVIGVSAPIQLRIKRTMERNGITREEVLGRMDNQMDEEQKLKLCDYVIINDDHHLILPQIVQLHEVFLQKAKSLLSQFG